MHVLVTGDFAAAVVAPILAGDEETDSEYSSLRPVAFETLQIVVVVGRSSEWSTVQCVVVGNWQYPRGYLDPIHSRIDQRGEMACFDRQFAGFDRQLPLANGPVVQPIATAVYGTHIVCLKIQPAARQIERPLLVVTVVVLADPSNRQTI